MKFTEINWLPFLVHLENLLGVPVQVEFEGEAAKLKCQDLTEYVGIFRNSVSAATLDFHYKFFPDVQDASASLWVTAYVYLENSQGTKRVILTSAWMYEEIGWDFATPE